MGAFNGILSLQSIVQFQRKIQSECLFPARRFVRNITQPPLSEFLGAGWSLVCNRRKLYAESEYFNSNTSPVRLLKLSADNSKYVRDFQHIQKFFAQNKNGCITMSNYLIRWNTSRLIIPRMHLLNFMQGFSQIPELEDKYADYELVFNFVAPYRTLDRFPEEHINKIISHLDKVAQFQKIVAEGASKEIIADIATQMWGSAEITDGCALDLKIIRIFEDLLDWSTSIRDLLNTSNVLSSSKDFNYSIEFRKGTTTELEAILNYITLKT